MTKLPPVPTIKLKVFNEKGDLLGGEILIDAGTKIELSTNDVTVEFTITELMIKNEFIPTKSV